jgi:hypothetical protein
MWLKLKVTLPDVKFKMSRMFFIMMLVVIHNINITKTKKVDKFLICFLKKIPNLKEMGFKKI